MIWIQNEVKTWTPVLESLTGEHFYMHALPEPGDERVLSEDRIVLRTPPNHSYISKWRAGQVLTLVNAEPTGHELAVLIDKLVPTGPVDMALLEQAYYGLAKSLDSPEDVQLLMRTGTRLWQAYQKEVTKVWLKQAQVCYHFWHTSVTTEKGYEVPLYKAMDFAFFSTFCKDHLGIPPSTGAQLRTTWEVFHVMCGWSVEEMERVGKAKLGIAAKRLRDLMEIDPSAAQQLQEDVKHLTFAALLDKIHADKAGGAAVRFVLELLEDPDMARKWLDPQATLAPDILHLQLWVDTEPLPDSMIILFDPHLDAENLFAAKQQLARLLHWNKSESSAESNGQEKVHAGPIGEEDGTDRETQPDDSGSF